MTGQWIIWLLVTGFAYVSGNQCDTAPAEKCFGDLVRYESSTFPLYGQVGADLEYTCENINESFACIETYIEECSGSQECKKPCQNLIKPMESFLNVTGLKNLEEELCEPSSNIRELYLQSYECLEKNSDAYSECHNKSNISLKYLHEINNKTATCCYFSLYFDCISNITQNHCDNYAMLFINSGLQKLLGNFASAQSCLIPDSKCSSPSTRPGEVDDKDPAEKKKDEVSPDDKVEHKKLDKVGYKDPDKENKNEEVPVEKVKDVNGSKTYKHVSNSASIISYTVVATVVGFYLIF